MVKIRSNRSEEIIYKRVYVLLRIELGNSRTLSVVVPIR